MKRFHDVAHHPDAFAVPELLLYRFGSAIVFFNASYFTTWILELLAAEPGLTWLVVDGSSVNIVDITGADTIEMSTYRRLSTICDGLPADLP